MDGNVVGARNAEHFHPCCSCGRIEMWRRVAIILPDRAGNKARFRSPCQGIRAADCVSAIGVRDGRGAQLALIVALAERHGIAFQLFEPKEPKKILKAYADNFATNRRQSWTH
eukprot:gene66562-91138_t